MTTANKQTQSFMFRRKIKSLKENILIRRQQYLTFGNEALTHCSAWNPRHLLNASIVNVAVPKRFGSKAANRCHLQNVIVLPQRAANRYVKQGKELE